MTRAYQESVIDSLGQLFESGTLTSASEAQLLERFVAHADSSAFEVILQRHGPMVLRVCQRVLDDPDDVDDAFQATFLILLKKAASIRDRTILAAWLHGVARRVAVRVRVNARQQRTRERSNEGGSRVQRIERDSLEANDLRAVLDEELERLPARFRKPLILCDLEGQTHEQAADRLRCPVGTVKSRLSRGRERLRTHWSAAVSHPRRQEPFFWEARVRRLSLKSWYSARCVPCSSFPVARRPSPARSLPRLPPSSTT